MWELICHHTYKAEGRPVDISRYDNPAERSGGIFLTDGVRAGSGALRFLTRTSHVLVSPSGPAWHPLVAIKVELTARLTDPSMSSQILIEGDNSFGVFVKAQQLFAYFVGKSIYPGMTSDGLSTYQDGIDPGYRVQFGQWTVLTFVHDGLSQMRLYADGAPVTVARSVLSAIPPVGPKGVSIGNGLSGGTPFGGDIDEVKVWRLDPYTNLRRWLSRPVDQATMDCWERFRASLDRAFEQYPDCALKLDAEFTAIMERLARAILDKGPESRQRFADVGREFDRLWRVGQVDGPEMAKLFADWTAWLRLVGISIDADPEVRALQSSVCFKLLFGAIDTLDCDPQYTALLKLIAGALGQSPAPSSQA